MYPSWAQVVFHPFKTLESYVTCLKQVVGALPSGGAVGGGAESG